MRARSRLAIGGVTEGVRTPRATLRRGNGRHRGRKRENAAKSACTGSLAHKQMPVVVLTRDSSIGDLSAVTVAPITSTIRGVPSEVLLTEKDGMKATCAINLHNVVTVSKAHLGRRVAVLSSARLREMCTALGFALGCA